MISRIIFNPKFSDVIIIGTILTALLLTSKMMMWIIVHNRKTSAVHFVVFGAVSILTGLFSMVFILLIMEKVGWIVA